MKLIKSLKQKHNIIALIASILVAIGLSMIWSVISGFFSGRFFRWTWISTLIIIFGSIPVFLYIKIAGLGSNHKKDALATSMWMDKVTFKTLFKTRNWNDEYKGHGFMIKSEINNSNNMKYNMSDVIGHSLVIGATRSGKTSRLVNPQIRILAKSGTSMIISDPKGELFKAHSKFLNENGYDVQSLNLRDYKKSAKWNPLEPIWNKWHENHENEDDKSMAKDEAVTRLNELANVIFAPPKTGDPIWIQGASTIFRFLAIGLLEISELDDSITKEHFNITNIATNLNSSTFDQIYQFADLLEVISKKDKVVSRALAIGGRNVRGAETTVNGMVQNAVTALAVYIDSKVKRIISSTTIKLDDSKPQAIFLITPDEDKSKNAFISLFVSEIYKELISTAENNGGQLKRPLYFILDEFGNIPNIPNIGPMVTVSASRSIFFMFIVQNYSQIEMIYGKETASIILGNCAYQYYLLTNDEATAESFSKRLGEKEIYQTSHSSSSNGNSGSSSQSTSKRTRRLMDSNELMKLPIGEAIVVSSRNDPIKTKLAPFWELKQFKQGLMDIKDDLVKDYDKRFYKDFVNGDEEPEDEEQTQELINTEEQRKELQNDNHLEEESSLDL